MIEASALPEAGVWHDSTVRNLLARARADPELMSDVGGKTDLQYARAALVKAQDAVFQFGPAHAPTLFICASFAVWWAPRLSLGRQQEATGYH
jgi:hypothetical protein